MNDSIEMLMLKVEHRFQAVEDQMAAIVEEQKIILKILENMKEGKPKTDVGHKEEHAKNNVRVIRFNLSELEKYLGFKD